MCRFLSHTRVSLWIERDNGNVHRAAANIIVFKSRAARGSVCNVLLSTVSPWLAILSLIIGELATSDFDQLNAIGWEYVGVEVSIRDDNKAAF